MARSAHPTLKSESQTIRKAIFEMGGEPLEAVFQLLGVPWPWCWFALDVQRHDVGLTDSNLPARPGDFDMLIGKRREDGGPDFGWIAAVETKRIVVRPDDTMPGRDYGTTQAAGLKQFGFDQVLLLHLVVRERRVDGALSPFPRDNRPSFTSMLHRHIGPHLDRSCGWLAIVWAHDENTQGDMEGGHGFNPTRYITPPVLRPKSGICYVFSRLRPLTYKRESARAKIVSWLKAQPRREMHNRAMLLGAG